MSRVRSAAVPRRRQQQLVKAEGKRKQKESPVGRDQEWLWYNRHRQVPILGNSDLIGSTQHSCNSAFVTVEVCKSLLLLLALVDSICFEFSTRTQNKEGQSARRAR